MRELETSLQQFGEFVLKAQLMKESAAPYPGARQVRLDAVDRRSSHIQRGRSRAIGTGSS